MSLGWDGVWVLHLDDARLAGCLGSESPRWLDADEARRAGALRDETASGRFVTAHAALRLLLGAATGVAPGDVRLLRAPCARCGEPHGKPHTPGGPGFSLSRSGPFAAIAIAQDARVGIDIEVRQPVSRVEPLRADLLAPGETSTDLLRTWVRKEALLKATGEGLTRSMASFRDDEDEDGGDGGATVRDLDLAVLGRKHGGVADGRPGPHRPRVPDFVTLVAAVAGLRDPVAVFGGSDCQRGDDAIGVGGDPRAPLFTLATPDSTKVRQPMPLRAPLSGGDLPESGE